MSRIGKKPVAISKGIEVRINEQNILVKGPKGELTVPFEKEFVSFKQEENEIIVERKNDEAASRARHGLYRNLLANAIQGVSERFTKNMEIHGVGYRASLKGDKIELLLGYSHPILFPIPQGIEIKFQEKSQTIFSVSGIDKQLVGQVAAEIREFRKPEPYKGKGIKYKDEFIVRKTGKSVTKK